MQSGTTVAQAASSCNPHYTPRGIKTSGRGQKVSGRIHPYEGLSDHSAEVLSSRGISPEVARDFAMEDWTEKDAREAGFKENARPGLAVMNYSLAGQPDREQLRPVDPVRDHRTGKPRKYLWTSADSAAVGGPPCRTPEARERAFRLRDDPTVPVVAVESLLKVASVETAARANGLDIFPISIHGNYGWMKNGAPRSDLGWIPWFVRKRGKVKSRRSLILMPDSDYWHERKHDVRAGWWRFGNYVREAFGAKVLIARVPDGPNGEKWGPDDALASGTVTLEDLIASAEPLPHSLPGVALHTLEDEADLDEVSRLRIEVAIRRNNEAAILQTATNPYLTDRQKVLRIVMAEQTLDALEKGRVDEDGNVELDRGKLSGDFRPELKKKGEAKQKTNPDGSLFRMPRKNVGTVAETLKAAGLVDFTTRPTTRTRKDGTRYTDTALIVRPEGMTLGEMLAPAARYVPEAYRPRADYGSRNRCPHCGEIHEQTVTRTTVCGSERDQGCGAIISRKTVIKTVPLANRPDITDEERAELDRRTANPDCLTKNVSTSGEAKGRSGEEERFPASRTPSPTYADKKCQAPEIRNLVDGCLVDLETGEVLNPASPIPPESTGTQGTCFSAPSSGMRTDAEEAERRVPSVPYDPNEGVETCIWCDTPVPEGTNRCRDHSLLSPEEYDRRYGEPAPEGMRVSA